MSDQEQPSQLKLFVDEVIEDIQPYKPLLGFPRQETSQLPAVKRLWVNRLKGFENLEIDFGNFNILVGANNCGKSTILQAIDLAFRLITFHVEFQRGVLIKPRAGKRIPDEILPIAVPEDFWFQRKYRVANERLPVVIGMELNDNLVFEFEIKRQWGGLNGRMTKFPEGVKEEYIKGILARRPTLVPASVGVVREEEWRVPARLEILSITGHHNEVLRNYLNELIQNKPKTFESLQNDLKKHFGGSISNIDFNSQTDQNISVNYNGGGFEHDIFSAGSGFLQVLQLITYLYLQTPGIVLLDEPDAHLHSSLQRLVIDLLENLSKNEKVQVIIATHSKEIINYVDVSHIIPIERHQQKAQSLEHHASVLPILQDLGSIDNTDLTALITSKKCLFVEGKVDKTFLAHFASKMESTVFEGSSQVVVIPIEGVDHPDVYLLIFS